MSALPHHGSPSLRSSPPGRLTSRLGIRLAAVTLVVGSAGGAIGGWVARESARAASRAEAEHLTVGLAERLANEIDTHIDDLATSLRLLATRDQILKFTDETDVELAVALRSLDGVSELDVHDSTDTLVAAVANDRLVDPTTVPPSALDDLGNQRVELTVGPESLVDITVPIQDPPGTTVGTLRGRVRIDTIMQVLEARLLGRSAKAIFVQPDGVILDHPERNRVLTERYPIELIPPREAGTFERDGTRVLAAMATAPTSGLPGAVIIEWEEREALSLADQQSRLVGALVALIVVATVAVVLGFTSRLLRPLASLRETLRRLATGDRGARAPEVGATEFRQVARDVNTMASAVDEQMTELHHSEQRFRRILSSSPDAFIVVDSSGLIEMASPRVRDLFGYEPSDLIGRPLEDLVPERLQQIHRAHRRAHPIDEAREMGSSMDLRARRADGTEFPVEISLSPIVMSHEPKVMATVRDLTERLEGAAAKRELSDMRERQRQAIEINDNIVQGLTIARWSFDVGDTEAARRAVELTVETARLLVDRMLSTAGDIEPGMLRRDLPAGPDR